MTPAGDPSQLRGTKLRVLDNTVRGLLDPKLVHQSNQSHKEHYEFTQRAKMPQTVRPPQEELWWGHQDEGWCHEHKNCDLRQLQSLNLIDAEILSPKSTVQRKGKEGKSELQAELTAGSSLNQANVVFGLLAELLDRTGRTLWWLQSHDLSCRLYLTFSCFLSLICIIHLIHSIVIISQSGFCIMF